MALLNDRRMTRGTRPLKKPATPSCLKMTPLSCRARGKEDGEPEAMEEEEADGSGLLRELSCMRVLSTSSGWKRVVATLAAVKAAVN
jgi:hypothetical protein